MYPLASTVEIEILFDKLSISNEIRYSDSLDLSKVEGKHNNSGDNVKKLDLIANNILKSKLMKFS